MQQCANSDTTWRPEPQLLHVVAKKTRAEANSLLFLIKNWICSFEIVRFCESS